MIYTRFLDDFTIEVIVSDGEKFTWKTYFATPKQDQKYYANKLAYYYQKFIIEIVMLTLLTQNFLKTKKL